MKVREAGRIVSVAVTIAVGVHADGRREVLGMAVGSSEAETFWLDFLRSLKRRGLAGVKLVVSVAHEGLAFGALPGDRAFDVDWLRAELDTRGATAVIPPKSNRKKRIDYDRDT